MADNDFDKGLEEEEAQDLEEEAMQDESEWVGPYGV